MRTGVVVKIVRSFGSEWGRIRPEGESRELFFNRASLVNPAEFQTILEGAEVEFAEADTAPAGARAVLVSRLRKP